MPKTRQQKEESLKEIKTNLQKARGVVFAGYYGLTVPEVEKLRRELRAEEVAFRVIKKTILQRALDAAKIEVEAKKLGEGLAAAFGLGDEVAPAKILAKFQKEHEALKIYGGLLENKFIDTAAVMSLAKLPGKLELYAKLVGSINAPVSGFVNTLIGVMRGLVNVLNGIKEAKTN